MTEAPEATATAPASGAENVQSAPVAPQAPTTPTAPETQAPATEQSAAPTAPSIPEKYEFTLAEGYQLDTQALPEFEAAFKDLGLTQEQAQKLVDLDAKRTLTAQQNAQEAAVLQRNQQVAAWTEELAKDPEFGGAAFETNVGIAMKAMGQFGTPQFKEFLETSGIGSHPEVVRFFHRVGKELGEGSVHRTTNDIPAERDLASRMYPNLN